MTTDECPYLGAWNYQMGMTVEEQAERLSDIKAQKKFLEYVKALQLSYR